MTCTRVRREVIECSRAATISTARWFVGHCRRHQDERKLKGGWPTRCQSSVSMWPEGAGGFSGDVKAGKVLNKMFSEPAPSRDPLQQPHHRSETSGIRRDDRNVEVRKPEMRAVDALRLDREIENKFLVE